MRSRSTAPLAFALPLTLALTLASVAVAHAETRLVEIRYEATVEAPPPSAHDAVLYLPLAGDDPHQELRSLRVDGAPQAEVVHDTRYGNAALLVHPHGAAHLVVTYVLARHDEHHDLAAPPVTAASPTAAAGTSAPAAAPPVPIARWLEPDKLGPLLPEVKRLAAKATAGRRTPLDKARGIYDLVVSMMSYDKSGEGWGRGDVAWACDAHRGNCTDFHTLFVAMARASGIPARFEIGLPLPPTKGAGEIPGYHCWARFFVDGRGWLPVDASEAKKHPELAQQFFGGHDANRVQFTVGRDLRFPGMKGELNYFIQPYAEVDGKPVKVTSRFAYRDLP